MTSKQTIVVVGVVLASVVQPAAQDNPQANSGSWRPTIVAQHGMVAAGHPLAAEAGMRILKAGGNAIDAAIATWAVQGEVEPGMTGLGADMFVLYYEAKTGKVHFINGTGFAPQAATIDFYKANGGIPDEGPLSSAVPGAVGGAAYAVKTYGTKKLGGGPDAGNRNRRRRVPRLRGAGLDDQQRAREDREIPVDDEDLFQGWQAAADRRRHPQSRISAGRCGPSRRRAPTRFTRGTSARTPPRS